MFLATPSGFRDVLPDEAQEREQIVRRVQDLFAENGFLPIETPTLEVMDVVNMGSRLSKTPFRFFDAQGDLLALRPDVTSQVSRMVASRLPDTDESLRLRYTQRVFRESDQDGMASSREITQMGVECINEDSPSVDAELIGLMIKALHAAGVSTLLIGLASVSPLRQLLDRAGADEQWKSSVLEAYHTSDFVLLDELCNNVIQAKGAPSTIAPAYADAIKALARVRGGKEAIDKARAIAAPLGCTDGLDALAEIYEHLEGEGLAEALLIDFSIISSFDYYTGVVFECFSPHLGAAIGSGGRYDNMISAYGTSRPAAGFAFSLEQAMAARAAEEDLFETTSLKGSDDLSCASSEKKDKAIKGKRPLRIAVPKGALSNDAITTLSAAGLDVGSLANPGRQLVIETPDVHYIIVRPSDAPAFVAFGAADCGICGKDSLLEADASVVELVDLGFGACRFVVAEPHGTAARINERYRKLGSIRIATKYPNVTRAYYARTGVQVDIVKLHGNIELAPLCGMADRIVDITATGNTLRQNDLVIVDEVLASTARFFANAASLRTDERVVELARKLMDVRDEQDFLPIAGGDF